MLKYITAGRAKGARTSRKSKLAGRASLRAMTAAVQLGALIAAAGSLKAAEVTWVSTGTNNWLSTAGWSTGAIPGANDLAVFNESSNLFAGPSGANTITVGGILRSGTPTSTFTIYPFNNDGAKQIVLNGYSTDLGDGPITLLIGNTSAGTLNVVNRQNTGSPVRLMPIQINTSGVIHADSMILLGSSISDNGNGYSITKTGSGVLQLGDSYPGAAGGNTFSGGFILAEGTVTSYFSSSVNTTTREIVASPFGTGTLTLRGGTLRTMSENSRTYYNAVDLDGSVTLGQTAGAGTGTGAIIFSAFANKQTRILSDSTLDVQNTTTWGQAITGSYGLTKTGVGTLITSGVNTYNGPTVIEGGVMYVNGSATASAFEVKSGAALSGSGSIYQDIVVRNGGTLGAGGEAVPGRLSTYAGITLEGGSNLSFSLVSATSFDSIYAEGAVVLDGAALQIELSYQPLVDEVFVLIQNEGFDPISGLLTYGGVTLADGALFTVSSGSYSQQFTIHYAYSEGSYNNSLALVAAVPEPSTYALLAVAGLGVCVMYFRRRANASA